MLTLHFAGVGPERTGTTWLHECLRGHPGVALPMEVKETGFFTVRHELGWEWYWSHFSRECEHLACGEIGATYLVSDDAAGRLWRHNPECRILVTLRDPVRRLESHYRELRRRGVIRSGFTESLANTGGLERSSHYAPLLRRWLSLFPRPQFLVLLLEDIASQPREALGRALDFLALEFHDPGDALSRRHNPSTSPRSRGLARTAHQIAHRARGHRRHLMVNLAKRLGLHRVVFGRQVDSHLAEPSQRACLAERFAEDIDLAEELTGRDLEAWRTGSGV